MIARKYPVTAPSGRQYEVIIGEVGFLPIAGYVANVYRQVTVKSGWLRRSKTKLDLLYRHTVDLEYFDGSFVELAKAAVMRCEGILAVSDAYQAAVDEFERWDGVIAP